MGVGVAGAHYLATPVCEFPFFAAETWMPLDVTPKPTGHINKEMLL